MLNSTSVRSDVGKAFKTLLKQCPKTSGDLLKPFQFWSESYNYSFSRAIPPNSLCFYIQRGIWNVNSTHINMRSLVLGHTFQKKNQQPPLIKNTNTVPITSLYNRNPILYVHLMAIQYIPCFLGLLMRKSRKVVSSVLQIKMCYLSPIQRYITLSQK